jgi:D-glycero-alpha-D-manno-heptose 1-phosphate guanylyltransferase
MNGDTWLEFDAAAMFAAHISLRSPITIAAVSVPNAGRFGSVGLEGGRIVAFNEKGTSGPGFINAGVYLVDREAVYADLPEGKFSWEQDYLAPNLARLQPAAFETRGPFIDIGIPEDYRAAQKLFAG